MIAIPTSPKNDRPSSLKKRSPLLLIKKRSPLLIPKKTIASPHSQKAIAIIITKNDRPLRSYPKRQL
ncbi:MULTISPECIES: hypothetical protein [Microcystis]|uniref:hypothetical protein n=1 Tax=Microcystis TaxID=1125 RepID=UPI0011EA6EB4|nr:hypothetical protein [Microcystis aeruginosa]